MVLTIKKVPTVVSNYQEENSEKGFEGCGRNCLGKCCLPGM
jgi:GDP-L-galactose phosphorylase